MATIAFLLFLTFLLVQGEEFEVRECGKFPYTRRTTAAVYDGAERIYFMGGRLEDSDIDVIEFNVKSHTFSTTRWELNEYVNSGSSAINAQGDIYYLGGQYSSGFDQNWKASTAIFKITPTDIASKVVNRFPNLPRIRRGRADVTIGDVVYLFGGIWEDSQGSYYDSNDIWTYNMTSNSVNELNVNLPYTMTDAAVVYNGQYVYIFDVDSTDTKRKIHRYDPRMSTFEQIAVTLPGSYTYPERVVLVGDSAYIIGESETIIVFDTKTETLSQVPTNLYLSSVESATYVESQHRIYIHVGEIYEDKMLCIDLPHPPVDCTTLPNGLYPNTSNCSKYIICDNGRTHHMDCPAQLHFHAQLLHCDYPENAQCPYEQYS